MQGGNKAEAGRSLEQGEVHHHIRPVEHQFREPDAQIDHAQRRRQCLRQNSGQRGSRYSHRQPGYQSQIQRQIGPHGQSQEKQRGPGIAHRPQHPGGQVVGESGGKSQEDDVQILGGVSGYGVRGLEQRQQRRQEQQPKPGQYNRRPRAEHAGQVKIPAEGSAVSRPVELRQQGTHAVASAADEEEEQVHHGARHSHRAEGGVPDKTAYDDRIHRVVELLQNISRQQRNGQADELPVDIAASKLCHSAGLLPFRLSISA